MRDQSALTGRVAIVTGAGRGLGRAEAHELARQGAKVVVNDFGVSLEGMARNRIERSPAEEVVKEIESEGGTAIAHQGDVADYATARDLIKCAVETFGDLHVVVNNAGILRDRMIFNLDEEDWDAVVRVHLRGHYCMTRWATDYWRGRAKTSGSPVDATLVNTASEAYLVGAPGQPNYAAAKGGIVALTLATARGCAKYGIRANAICPRANTRMTAGGDGGADDPFAPERIAPLIAFLASSDANRVNGQVFVAYGDMIALLGAPQVEQRFDAEGEHWTVAGVRDALTPVFANRKPLRGYIADEVRGLDGGTWAARDR